MRALFPMALAYFLMLAAAVPAGAQEATVAYGAGFSIEHRQGYKVLTVKSPWPGSSASFTYVLYKRGQPKPSGLKADGFFETPDAQGRSPSPRPISRRSSRSERRTASSAWTAPAFVNSPELRDADRPGQDRRDHQELGSEHRAHDLAHARRSLHLWHGQRMGHAPQDDRGRAPRRHQRGLERVRPPRPCRVDQVLRRLLRQGRPGIGLFRRDSQGIRAPPRPRRRARNPRPPSS